MRKIITICLITIFVSICVIVGVSIYNYKKTNIKNLAFIDNENNDDLELDFENRFGLYNLTDDEKKQIIDWEVNGAHELIRLMCMKNGDWSKLPISKEIRKQFNEKEGILKDYEFENVEVDYEGVEFYDASPAKIIITNGNDKRRVYIDYRFDDDGINNINIKDVITIVDSEGNKLNEGFPFDDSHIVENFDTWDNVGLTNKYIVNHGKELLNLFIHYSPLDYNPITFVENKSELNNHMAYFIVTSVLECKEREYKVYYQLDENNYLDDAHAVCVKERELEPDDKELFNKVFFKNSNWKGLNLTDNFKKKFNNANGVFPDIGLISYDFDWGLDNYECIGVKKGLQLVSFKLIDGNKYYYLYSILYDQNHYLDDVVYTKLPYKNMSAEEVKELYLKDMQNEK